MESRKIVLMNLFARQQWRKSHKEQTYGHREEKGGEGEMYGDRNMETYTAIRKPANQCEFDVWHRAPKVSAL